MKTRLSSIQKIIILLCVITLPACRFRADQNQEPSDSQTSTPSSTNPAIPSPTHNEQTAVPLQFVTGRNDYVITVDDTEREFIVFVPGGYDPGQPTPVVFVFHGSNMSGNVMYEITNWVTTAEQDNFMVVFPTSWKYLLTSSNRIEDKWNDMMMEVTEPDVEFKDDVQFIKVILEHLNASFNMDEKRIFATGFSNGALFVINRLLLQMNDVFAAFATAGAGPGPAEEDTSEITYRVNTSLYQMFGTRDAKVAEIVGLSLPFPFEAEEILNDPNFYNMLVKNTTALNLDMSYSVQSDTDSTSLTFDQSPVGSDNEYIFQMIRGMPHVIPDGINNLARLDATVLFWDFFMRHSKP